MSECAECFSSIHTGHTADLLIRQQVVCLATVVGLGAFVLSKKGVVLRHCDV